MAADGGEYREKMKYILASKQDIIDYRNELVKMGWTSREEDTDAEWKDMVQKDYQIATTGRKRNSAAISADVNIICFIQQHYGHQHDVIITERSLKW